MEQKEEDLEKLDLKNLENQEKLDLKNPENPEDEEDQLKVPKTVVTH